MVGLKKERVFIKKEGEVIYELGGDFFHCKFPFSQCDGVKTGSFEQVAGAISEGRSVAFGCLMIDEYVSYDFFEENFRYCVRCPDGLVMVCHIFVDNVIPVSFDNLEALERTAIYLGREKFGVKHLPFLTS